KETKLAHPYHLECVAFRIRAAVACQIGNSSAVGVSVALNPTILGRKRFIGPSAYPRAVPRWLALKRDLPARALPTWNSRISPQSEITKGNNGGRFGSVSCTEALLRSQAPECQPIHSAEASF